MIDDRRVSLPASGWLVSKSKLEQAEKVLVKYNGHVADYDVHEEIVRRLHAFSVHPTDTLRASWWPRSSRSSA